MTSRPAFSIPQPCAQPWAAMPATATGRHCGACATEVVDFTRLSDAEILAYLARRGSGPVCVCVLPAQLAAPVPPRWRRWLLAGLALLGWQAPAQAGPPVLPPAAETGGNSAKPGGQVVVRGAVIDDQNGQPVARARVFIKGTKYGTETDEQGRFELVMAEKWPPLKGGKLVLHIEASPFDFQPQDLTVALHRPAKPVTLTVRLLSIPNRGQVMGKMARPTPPVKPPRG